MNLQTRKWPYYIENKLRLKLILGADRESIERVHGETESSEGLKEGRREDWNRWGL